MLSTLLLLSGLEVVSHKKIDIDISKSDKATVIAFVSAKCPCSSSHELKLKKLSAEYTSKGFNFVAVHSNVDEDEKTTKQHFESSGFSFPVIEDQNSKIANTLGALKTPHVFILNPKGELLFSGGVDDSHNANTSKNEYLKDALTAINLNKKPEIAQARTLGCVIQRN